MIPLIGLAKAATYLIVLAALWATGAFFYGLRREDRRWIRSGRHAVTATWYLTAFASAVLIAGLVNNWWHLEYVWRTSLPQQPLIYKIGAFWGGMAGSMLFWLLILTGSGALLEYKSREERDNLSDYALAVVSVVILFFSFLTAGVIPGIANPFKLLPPETIAAIQRGELHQGMGLNPLLQTPSMLLHPPNLYGGYVVSTIPFAFAIGALAAGSGSAQWIVRSRRWTIAAWLFLTLGNLIGGGWAYGELGWGGYWGWDPVENAALLPWLTITAFLHSVMIQEHRNMLKLWNIFLIAITFQLVLFGTTLVRSGVLSSIHAFAQSKVLLSYFIGFQILAAAVTVYLVAKRWKQLRSANRLDALLSREAMFLLNNWVLVIAAVVVFAGTTYPILSEAYFTFFKGIEGRKIAVSAPFYNTFIVPLGLLLLLLTGIGPMISWKKATPSNVRRNFLGPTVAGLVAGALSVYPFVRIGMGHPGGFPLLKTIYSVLCVYASVFVLATVVVEYWKGARVRMRRGAGNLLEAIAQLTWRNKRRYGGYIVHVAVVLFYLGTMASMGFQISHRVILNPGETFQIAGYTLTLGERFQERKPNAWFVGVRVNIDRGGKRVAVLKPALGIFDNNEGPPTREVAILRRLTGDLYIALGEMSETGQTDMQVYYNPFAWIVLIVAPIVAIIGGAISLLERGRVRVKSDAAKESPS